MIDVEQFIQKLQEDYHENHPNGPALNLKWNPKGRGEAYTLKYAGNTATVEGESPQAAVFGLSLLRAALSSGHLAEYLGKHTPKLSLRPLWIRCLRRHSLADDQSLERMCQRILLYGYNTIIFDFTDLMKNREPNFLEKALDVINSYGIRVAINLGNQSIKGHTFLDSDYTEHLTNTLLPVTRRSDYVDYLFWESTIYAQDVYHHPKARDYLQLDLARMEIESIENQLDGKCQLIYYIPTENSTGAEKQSDWIPALCHEISSKTVVAFSSLAGDPCSDYLSPHPIWDKLRAASHYSNANLLPLVNVGLVNQGEGLWPTLSLDHINRYLLRSNNSTFSGVIAITSHIPKEDAVLSCSLWTASHTLWGNAPPNLLMGTWFGAFRPEFLMHRDLEKTLEEIRDISVKIGLLTSYITEKREELSKDEYRTLTDSLLSRLRCLQTHITIHKVESEGKPNLHDYFLYFVRDARRLILRFLQHYQMPMVSVLDGDDMKESFWTKVSNPNPQGLTSGAEVFLLDEPQQGEPGSVMARIYEEVTN